MKFQKLFLIGIIALFAASCNKTGFVLTGEKAYELKQYSKAPELLQKEFKREVDKPKKSEIVFEAAESYRKYNQYAKAEAAYKKAIEYGKKEAFFELGKTQMSQEKYDKAIESFNEFAKLGTVQKAQANREIKNCQNAIDWINFPSNYIVKNEETVNSTTNDFAPTFSNGKLYFTSSRTSATGETVRNAWTNELNADIFYATRDASGIFSSPQPFSDIINTDAFEGTCAFNTEGTEFYFTRCATTDFSTKNENSKERILSCLFQQAVGTRRLE
ncbi:MAG: hypothetical protein QM775_05995 [Pirellulales bacterium]